MARAGEGATKAFSRGRNKIVIALRQHMAPQGAPVAKFLF